MKGINELLDGTEKHFAFDQRRMFKTKPDMSDDDENNSNATRSGWSFSCENDLSPRLTQIRTTNGLNIGS